MKKSKIIVYIIGLILIAVPFKFAYLAQTTSFSTNLISFLSVLTGFMVLIIFGSTDGQEEHH